MTHQRLRSSLLGLLFGAIYGGAAGGIILGLSTYLDEGSSLLGPARNWTHLAILAGLAFGGVTGSVLGGVIGATRADRRSGMLIGVGVGILVALPLFIDGANTYMPTSTGLVALGMIVLYGLLGLLVANVLRD